MIPMVNLKRAYAEIAPEIEAGFAEILSTGQFILGPKVAAFEQAAAEYLGVRHAIGVASGTDALHLALRACGIGQGDEVITTAFTFIATAEAICYVGAKPVFVDIDAKTFNIDVEKIEAAITEKTKAVLPVHLFGQPANLPRLQELCQRHDLTLIEDCAQSFGAAIGGRMTGSFGKTGAFSFFPSKNLGAFGDGGLVVCQDDTIAETLNSLRNHGSVVRYYHDRIGYNSRLDALQAWVLSVKLQRIDQYNAARRQVADGYREHLAHLPLTLPFADGIGEHVYHQYTLLTDRREAIAAALQQHNIASAVYYPVPLHQQQVFAEVCAGLSLPVTESVAKRCLSLPICPMLREAEVQQIAQVIAQSLA
ncbi:MAG: DegT/DnrJ/EryC1/StrS family aminotransferase [Methylococcales bacterium]|nr:DegT/DnrJ/EryC1/StrS family aminotransferase [Methylococcales bacterium]